MNSSHTKSRKAILPVVLVVSLMALACGACPLATSLQPPEVQEIEKVVTRIVEVMPTIEAAVKTPVPQVVPATPASEIDIIIEPGADVETEILNAVYRKVNPSVVNITTNSGQGSGFVWDDNGHIVTNAHVLQDADAVFATFSDGVQLQADIVGSDGDSDLAVVKVDPGRHDLRPVEIGDVDNVEVGDRAIAIGSPFAHQNTLTQGIISAKGRSISGLTNYEIPEALQTDAAINPGNSGGPLLDAEGRVIGINAQIDTGNTMVRVNAGIGFAIPVNIASRVVPALIEDGHYDHPYLGITGLRFSPGVWEALGLDPEQRGAYVTGTVPGGPSDDAGIRAGTRPTGEYLPGPGGAEELHSGGDLIVAIDDLPVLDFGDLLIYLFRNASPGDTVQISVLRGGSEMVIPVRLGTRPRN